ncbi:hypothetical protein DERF_001620 [Dermatophagoides farinae]|uniref:Uncharacterized protein n=1 Tax=Dermatophagoides farinae TaxID=6954 RepID=A0A922IFA9_DERFA|nr:hypothetical protein DERF_001620 [Dermatophagoides farinae]
MANSDCEAETRHDLRQEIINVSLNGNLTSFWNNWRICCDLWSSRSVVAVDNSRCFCVQKKSTCAIISSGSP